MATTPTTGTATLPPPHIEESAPTSNADGTVMDLSSTKGHRTKNNDVPDTNENRHFLAPASITDDHTLRLVERYKLDRFGDEDIKFVPTLSKRGKVGPYTAYASMTVLRTQNLPYYMSSKREHRATGAQLSQVMATALSAYLMYSHNMPNCTLHVECLSIVDGSVKLPFIEFCVRHNEELHLGTGERKPLPLLVDRNGVHVGPEPVMMAYTSLFSRTPVKGQRAMSQADRHYITAGLPSSCLNIEVVSKSPSPSPILSLPKSR